MGLPPEAAAAKLLWLIDRMRRLRLTGVGLKDEQPQIASEAGPDWPTIDGGSDAAHR